MFRIAIDQDLLEIDLGHAEKPVVPDRQVRDLPGRIHTVQPGLEDAVTRIGEMAYGHDSQVGDMIVGSWKRGMKHFVFLSGRLICGSFLPAQGRSDRSGAGGCRT